MLKPILSAALALSLIGGTAAYADPYHGPHYEHRGWGYHERHHDNGAATAAAVGIGLFALVAIAAANEHDREARAHERDYRDLPPPDRDRGSYYGQDRDPNYGRDYGPDYGPNDDRDR